MLVVVLLSCLHLSGALQSGIFGGKEAKPHSRPYMASLQVGKHHVCGGVLIREDYVLTAAHCLKYKPDVVVLGAHNISREEKSQQRVAVSESIPHQKYRPVEEPWGHQHDIMLLKLDPPVQLTESVSVLELPKRFGYLKAGMRCEVSGWGRRMLGRGVESVLYETTVILDSNGECESKWQQYYNKDQMVCTVSDGKDGFCQGDSGGPLVCWKGKSRVLYGTTAYTDVPCDKPGYPEVYMRVPFFLPWIRSVMGDN
ncbi:mast cell protease 1A-like [Engraulis encrasicolus]|uniref:mast cell protease 1A-like n=1 Tax=Engraulis encrasicolus TaxID=184585 RepID=UPI002FD0CE40